MKRYVDQSIVMEDIFIGPFFVFYPFRSIVRVSLSDPITLGAAFFPTNSLAKTAERRMCSNVARIGISDRRRSGMKGTQCHPDLRVTRTPFLRPATA